MKGQKDVAALLLDRGAAIEAKDNVSRLQCACSMRSLGFVRGQAPTVCRTHFQHSAFLHRVERRPA